MQVLCLWLPTKRERLTALAEACLAFSPQVALGTESVFLEIEGSEHLISREECILRLKEVLQVLDLPARLAIARSVATAQGFARFGVSSRDALPIESLSDYLQPFAPEPFRGVELFHKLGVQTLGDFLKIPRRELPARFGKLGLLAYERLLEAERVAWPRFQPIEKLAERVDLDSAAQIATLEPVFFLLKTAFHRIFLRLYARREKLAACTIKLHLNKFSGRGDRVTELRFPLPQGEVKNVLTLAAERLQKELELRPLEDALEGVSVFVTDTAPFPNTQKDFFSKVEEEREAWASLVGRLHERLGEQAAFLSIPQPRLRPEASWAKTLLEGLHGEAVSTPLRPLRLLSSPLPLRRVGDWLLAADKKWRFTAFRGPERLRGEWWLGGFEREYFVVETEVQETLWVFTAPESPTAPRSLWLHGIYD